VRSLVNNTNHLVLNTEDQAKTFRALGSLHTPAIAETVLRAATHAAILGSKK